MPSNSPSLATIENVSGKEREPTPRQRGVEHEKVPLADDYPHEHHMAQKQEVPEDDPIHLPSRNDTEKNPSQSSDPPLDLPLPKLSDPLNTQIPKPDGDPFEYVLKTMLERDTIRCNAWKDEVQNILIFAGLFPAVVTAFIIESCRRLQRDPNDAIVGLLAHIAEKLDNPSINATASVSSIVADTNFSPSRPDIAINVFWFISLVLSLTAALIGIVTLQWLREHQRYDTTLKPRETMAILNARIRSLTRWYVPHIFAGLPLLLQGAIILFFAGMIEFLFALSLDVAVPVLLSICIPVLFLITTTLLPVLQMCILTDPFRLSINNSIPSPCPYKSPQSLIARRFSTASGSAFEYLALMVGGIYICVVRIICFLRKLRGRRRWLPIFRLQRTNLTLRLGDMFPQSIRWSLPASRGDWASIDRTWLQVRTTYAISLQLAHRHDDDLTTARTARVFVVDGLSELPEGLPTDLAGEWRQGTVISSPSLLPEVLDCTHAIIRVLAQVQANTQIHSTAYHCLAALCSQPFPRKEFHFSLGIIAANHNQSGALLMHLTDICMAFGQFLHYIGHYSDILDWHGYPPISALSVQDVISNEPSRAAEILGDAFMVSSRRSYLWQHLTNIEREWSSRLVATRLEISPLRLFSMSSSKSWLPANVYSDITTEAQVLGNRSHSITKLFLAFLENCSIMKPSSELSLRPSPEIQNYGGIRLYTRVIVWHQDEKRIADTLTHLTWLCNSNEDIVQEKPFLLLAACFYLDVAAHNGHVRTDEPLLKLILKACGINEHLCSKMGGWHGLDAAIDAIYHHHNPQAAQLPTSLSIERSDFAISLTDPNEVNGLDYV